MQNLPKVVMVKSLAIMKNKIVSVYKTPSLDYTNILLVVCVISRCIILQVNMPIVEKV